METCSRSSLDDAERRRLSNHFAAVLSKARIGDANGSVEIRDAVRAAGVPLQR